MFTDIVGSTALMAQSEEAGLRAKARHREIVRPQVERYGGELIEDPGDQTLSIFRNALDAVNCALTIQEELVSDPNLMLHVGIHTSDILIQDGEVSGDGVNIAARICAISEGDAPFISDEVHHAVQNQAHLDFEALGEQELKNVPRPVPVYRVSGTIQAPRPLELVPVPSRLRRRGALVAAAVAAGLCLGGLWWWHQPVATQDPIRSIAVLPLENLSGDPEQEYFADGMTDALIANLARLGALRVISRRSIMQYKGTHRRYPRSRASLDVMGTFDGGASASTRPGEYPVASVGIPCANLPGFLDCHREPLDVRRNLPEEIRSFLRDNAHGSSAAAGGASQLLSSLQPRTSQRI